MLASLPRPLAFQRDVLEFGGKLKLVRLLTETSHSRDGFLSAHLEPSLEHFYASRSVLVLM